MRQHLGTKWLKLWAFTAALLAVCGVAEDRVAAPASAGSPNEVKGRGASPTGPSSPVQKDGARPATAEAKPANSAEAILQMMDAGVSAEVIKTYVEHSSEPYNPTAADIIAFKERRVPDEITSAFLKKSAENRARTPQATGDRVAVVVPKGAAYSGSLDPEGYDYFQQHYLYPRTLASAYERLYPFVPDYYGGYGPYYGRGYTLYRPHYSFRGMR